MPEFVAFIRLEALSHIGVTFSLHKGPELGVTLLPCRRKGIPVEPKSLETGDPISREVPLPVPLPLRTGPIPEFVAIIGLEALSHIGVAFPLLKGLELGVTLLPYRRKTIPVEAERVETGNPINREVPLRYACPWLLDQTPSL